MIPPISQPSPKRIPVFTGKLNSLSGNEGYLIALLILINVLFFKSVTTQWYYADDFHWLYIGQQALKQPFLIFTHSIFHYYRPVINATFYLEYLLYGFNALGHHLFNLLVHVCAATVLYLILRQIIHSANIAFVSALMCSTSPGITDGIVWISGRIDLLATLFFLLSIYFFLSSIKNPRLFNTMGICFFILAFLSKEMAITLPICLFLIEVSYRETTIRNWIKARWVLLIISLFLFLMLIGYQMKNGGPYLFQIPIEFRFSRFMQNCIGTIPFLLLAPFQKFITWPVILIVTFLLLSIFFFMARGTQKKQLATSLLIIVILSAPASMVPYSFFPDPHFTFRRFFYLPQFGVALTISIMLSTLKKINYNRKIILGMLLLIYLSASFISNSSLQKTWFHVTQSRLSAVRDMQKQLLPYLSTDIIFIVVPDKKLWPEMFHLFSEYNIRVLRNIPSPQRTEKHPVFIFTKGRLERLR